MKAWLAWWPPLAALYVLLVGTLALPELVIAAIAASVGATGAVLVQPRLPRPRPRLAWRPLADLFPDALRLAWALVRGTRGRFEEVPFEGGAEAEALGSLAPCTIVVAVDRERGVLLIHRLAP
jgi:hypothetical protein